MSDPVVELWPSGTGPGRNWLGRNDTMRRFIPIPGTPDEAPMGVARSRGCVRMRNRDGIELFDLVESDTPIAMEG